MCAEDVCIISVLISLNRGYNMKKKSIIYENYFNKANSLIKSINKLFVTMLILLGIITFVSAFKEVSREVRTCLDEKFSLVFCSMSSKINKDLYLGDDKIEAMVKTELDESTVGKHGFNAILKIEDGVVQVKYLTEATFKNTDLEQSLNRQENILSYIAKSKRPLKFMDIDFEVNAKDMVVDNSLYRIRISDTDLENCYLLSASGQDEYLFKKIRIILQAVALTLIFTPILIQCSKYLLKTLSDQLKDLNVLVKSIASGDTDQVVVESLCSSKNEIGDLANSIKDLVSILEERSKTDELTGIGNRRKLYEFLENFNNADNKGPLSVIFVDIDYFKKFNDNYGHLRGDIALKKVASIINEICSTRNVLATRYGGEEFVIVYQESNEDAVLGLVKEIQNRLEVEDIEHLYSLVSKKVTLSIGVAIADEVIGDVEDVLLKADEAVYSSKEGGRNRYTCVKI